MMSTTHNAAWDGKMRDGKGRVEPTYVGLCSTQRVIIDRVFSEVADALENRSKARLLRILIWAGLQRLGVEIPAMEDETINRLGRFRRYGKR
jgi:hypothetical protein